MTPTRIQVYIYIYTHSYIMYNTIIVISTGGPGSQPRRLWQRVNDTLFTRHKINARATGFV